MGGATQRQGGGLVVAAGIELQFEVTKVTGFDGQATSYTKERVRLLLSVSALGWFVTSDQVKRLVCWMM